jgi:O-antigen/teichoic acid export membrane protein
MLKQIGELGKHTVIYGLGDALRRLIGFMLLPLYTTRLSPADYGELDLSLVVLALSGTFAVQGLKNAFFRHYTVSDDPEERTALLSSTFIYMLATSLLIYSLIYFLADELAGLLFTDGAGGQAVYVRLVALVGFFETISIIPLDSFRANMQPVPYVVILVVGFLLQTAANIYLVAGLGLGVRGVLIGYLIGAAVIAAAAIVMARHRMRPIVVIARLRELLAFGLPLIPVGLAWWLLGVSNRVLLERFASSQELGLYSLGYKMANILAFAVITPFTTAWGPYVYRTWRGPRAKETYAWVATHYLLVLSIVGMGLVAFTRPVLRVISAPAFWDAHRVVLPLVGASMAYGMMSIFDLGINITKRTKHFSYIIGSGGLLNVALNVVLIPRYGMMGAGASLLLAYVGTMVLSAYVAQRFYPVPYEFVRMGRIAGVFVAAGVLTTLVQFEQPLADLAFRLFALVAFGGGLVAAGVFSQTDVTALRRLYAGMRRERGLRAKVRFGVEQFRPD